MEKIIKETVISNENDVALVETTPVVITKEAEATGYQTLAYFIYFFFGLIDVMLLTRFILKLLGASTSNGFVELIYGVTGILIAPFAGIFRAGVSEGIETKAVFDPATLIAIIVYTAIAWGIVKLVQITSGKVQAE